MRRPIRTNLLIGLIGAAVLFLFLLPMMERLGGPDRLPSAVPTTGNKNLAAPSATGVAEPAVRVPTDEAVVHDSDAERLSGFRCIVTSDDGGELVDVTGSFKGPFGDAPATSVQVDAHQLKPDRVEFLFSVFPPTFSFVVECGDRVPARFSATEFGNPSRTAVGVLERRRECTLSGRVIDPTGQPIAHGLVTARALGSTTGWRFGKSVPLAQDGSFGFRDVPSGRPIVISFVGTRFVHEPVSIRALEPAEARHDVILTATEATTVRCFVVDSRTKRPIAGAWVFQRARQSARESDVSAVSTISTVGPRETGDDGGADVVVIRGQSTLVEIRCPGYVTLAAEASDHLGALTFELEARRTIDIDFIESSPCEIPAPAVTNVAHPIAASGFFAQPGTALAFVLRSPGVPDRDLDFDWVIPLRSARVEVGTLDPSAHISIRLGTRELATRSLFGVSLNDRLSIQLNEAEFCARGSLRARLVLDDGSPYVGVVSFQGRMISDGGESTEERSGAITLTPATDGTVDFTRLAEADYVLSVLASDQGVANVEREFHAVVVAGTTTLIDDIELTRAGRVEVLIQTDDDADALASIAIHDDRDRRVIRSTDGAEPIRLSTGVPCVLSDVPVGLIRVVARAPGYATAAAEVAVVPEELSEIGIRLSRGERCSIRILDSNIKPSSHWSVRADSIDVELESGVLRGVGSDGVPSLELRLDDGAYVLEFEGPHGAAISKRFTVSGATEILIEG